MKKRYGEDNEKAKEIIYTDYEYYLHKKRNATNSKVNKRIKKRFKRKRKAKKKEKAGIITASIVMAIVITLLFYISISNFNIFKKISFFLKQKSDNLKFDLSTTNNTKKNN